MVSHDSASKECKKKLGEAYALNKKLDCPPKEDLKNLKRKKEQDQKSRNKGQKKLI